jgi:hypothetical protein
MNYWHDLKWQSGMVFAKDGVIVDNSIANGINSKSTFFPSSVIQPPCVQFHGGAQVLIFAPVHDRLFNPPKRPSATAAGFFSGSFLEASVTCLTIEKAIWLTSFSRLCFLFIE